MNTKLPTNLGFSTNYIFTEVSKVKTLICDNPHCPYHYTPIKLTISQMIYVLHKPKRQFCSYNCRSDFKRKFLNKTIETK